MPAAFFVAGLSTRFAPLEWWLPAATLIALQLAAALAVLRLLRTLLGSRPVLLVPAGGVPVRAAVAAVVRLVGGRAELAAAAVRAGLGGGGRRRAVPDRPRASRGVRCRRFGLRAGVLREVGVGAGGRGVGGRGGVPARRSPGALGVARRAGAVAGVGGRRRGVGGVLPAGRGRPVRLARLRDRRGDGLARDLARPVAGPGGRSVDLGALATGPAVGRPTPARGGAGLARGRGVRGRSRCGGSGAPGSCGRAWPGTSRRAWSRWSRPVERRHGDRTRADAALRRGRVGGGGGRDRVGAAGPRPSSPADTARAGGRPGGGIRRVVAVVHRHVRPVLARRPDRGLPREREDGAGVRPGRSRCSTNPCRRMCCCRSPTRYNLASGLFAALPAAPRVRRLDAGPAGARRRRHHDRRAGDLEPLDSARPRAELRVPGRRRDPCCH